MEIGQISPALRERLGAESTAGLADLFGQARTEWTADVLGIVGDRFERRLTEETSKIRTEMAQGFAAIRQDMAAGQADLRQEMTNGLAGLRQEMTNGLAGLRQEMTNGLAGLRQEMTNGLAGLRQEMTQGFGAQRQELADYRFEILKWAFIFWIGQFFAMASLVALLIRFLRPTVA